MDANLGSVLERDVGIPVQVVEVTTVGQLPEEGPTIPMTDQLPEESLRIPVREFQEVTGVGQIPEIGSIRTRQCQIAKVNTDLGQIPEVGSIPITIPVTDH